MISTQKKFLFIHVPKTGGNSIQSILLDYYDDVIVTVDGPDKFQSLKIVDSKYNTSKHSSLARYKSALDSRTYHSLFKFSTIRNPWEKVISYYFSPHFGVPQEWDRNKFIRLVGSIKTLRYYICEISFLERVLTHVGGITIHGGHHKLARDIDFLMRFEHLSDDFGLVCKKLGIPYSGLPKRNSSARHHYSKYYDEELKEIVRKKFKDEIALGNYTFENG